MKNANPSPKTEPKSAPPVIPVHCAHDRLARVSDLLPHPQNPNRHPETQLALLAKVIQTQGWRAPVVVSKRSGMIVSGHGRVAAAKLLKAEVVPVNDQDFASEADELAHLLADNRIAELADMNEEALQTAIDSLKTLGGIPEIAGFSDLDLNALAASLADESHMVVQDQRKARRCTCPKCGHRWFPAA